MKVDVYNQLMALQTGRRNFMKGVAALAAGTALGSSLAGRAMAAGNLRAA